MRKKNLLIDEYPLLVLPSLAKMIGLNEAIALQQLHYWINNPKGGVWFEGELWTYNTYEEWQRDNFPFWSVRTVQRIFLSLESMELVVAMQRPDYYRRKYYRPHYANLAQWNDSFWHDPLSQVGTMEGANLASSLTETTRETTSEITSDVSTETTDDDDRVENERREATKKKVKEMMEKAEAKQRERQAAMQAGGTP